MSVLRGVCQRENSRFTYREFFSETDPRRVSIWGARVGAPEPSGGRERKTERTHTTKKHKNKAEHISDRPQTDSAPPKARWRGSNKLHQTIKKGGRARVARLTCKPSTADSRDDRPPAGARKGGGAGAGDRPPASAPAYKAEGRRQLMRSARLAGQRARAWRAGNTDPRKVAEGGRFDDMTTQSKYLFIIYIIIQRNDYYNIYYDT